MTQKEYAELQDFLRKKTEQLKSRPHAAKYQEGYEDAIGAVRSKLSADFKPRSTEGDWLCRMSAERAKQLLFEVLQLFREKAEEAGQDPSDFDSWLFSELDMEIQELEEVYAPYPGVSVHGGSCYDPGQSPKDFDRKFFS